jgi:hypothetical protein
LSQITATRAESKGCRFDVPDSPIFAVVLPTTIAQTSNLLLWIVIVGSILIWRQGTSRYPT